MNPPWLQRRGLLILCLALFAQLHGQSQDASTTQLQPTADLRSRIEESPILPFTASRLAAQPPTVGWKSGAVSGIAIAPTGLIYEIQRGDKADPVLVLDRKGTVLRSWGKGNYQIPHSIRIDPAGNVWTVDAASSHVIKYSPTGRRLTTFTVGEQPENGSLFHGITDIAFGPNHRLYITDGYGNARVLEYTLKGRRVKQWGKPGTGPAEFHLPHAIQISADGILYIADRENGRIQEFDLDGHLVGEIPDLGRIYALKLAGDVLWATTSPFDQAPGSGNGWIIKLDRHTGKFLGHLDDPQPQAGHAIDLTPAGEPIITLGNEVLWCKAQ